MVIYKFENKINGKVYIGQTVQKLSKRISSHKYPSSNKNLPIDAAIKKYGIENFNFELIEVFFNAGYFICVMNSFVN